MQTLIWRYLLPTLFLVTIPFAAHANQIYELRSLDFGAFAVTQPGGARRIVIDPTGAQTTPDGGLVIFKNGHNSIFRISQLNPATLFYITIDPSSVVHSSTTPEFEVDTFTFDPPNDIGNMIHTDPDASLTIRIGATLHIEAGETHTPGPYRGTFTFLINY